MTGFLDHANFCIFVFIVVLEERNMKIATKLEDWPRALRRASVNSFGYGGANAHIVLEATESYLGQNYLSHSINSFGNQLSVPQSLLLPISASSAQSLEARIQQLSQLATQGSLQSLAHTLAKGRDNMRNRSFLLTNTDGRLSAVDEAPRGSGAEKALSISFVFTGQGAQFAGMAKELLLQNEHFRNTIRGLDGVLKTLPAPQAPAWTIEQTLLDAPDISRINEVTHSQPICTAIQIGIVDLLRSWGVLPTSVVGHSSGEIAAAYAAGLLTSTQAILVAYYRGYTVAELQSQGAMMAAGVGAAAANDLIQEKGLEGQVRVACVNAPESVTLSGSPDAIGILEQEFQGEKKFARRLETGGRAYHSHMMKEIGSRYQELLTPLFHPHDEDTSPVVTAKMYSSVGHSPEDLKVLDHQTDMAAYWRQNLEQPVQFSSALATLAEGGQRHLIEIGPHSALKGPIQQIRTAIGLDKDSLPYSATLVRKQDAELCLKKLAGTLFVHGHELNLSQVNTLPESGLQTLHDLQPYQWDYSGGLRWSEPRASVEIRNRKHLRHELLGTLALTGNGIDYTWRNLLRPSEIPWIQDHKLEDQVVFPATGYMALAIEAVSQITGVKDKPRSSLGFEFRSVNISTAFVVPDENDAAAKDLELHTTMSLRKISTANSSANWHDFSISSWAAGQTTVHCTGSIRLTDTRKTGGSESTTVENHDNFEAWSMSRWYSKWQQEGLCFGPNFQSLSKFQTDAGRSRCEAISVTQLEPPVAETGGTKYPVHPITIDACIQAAILGGTAGHLSTLKAYLPVFISHCRIQPAEASGSAEVEIHSRSVETGFSSRRVDSTLWDTRGTPVVELKDVRMSLYTGKNVSQQQADDNGPLSLYMQRQPALRVHWKPDVSRLSSIAENQIRGYVADFVDRQPEDLRDDESLSIIGAIVDLVGHKSPRMRVLELGGDGIGYKAKQWLKILDHNTAFSRCLSWHSAQLDEDGVLSIEDGHEGPFEVLILPAVSITTHTFLVDH
jgi:acyl transferase domain-containing protein